MLASGDPDGRIEEISSKFEKMQRKNNSRKGTGGGASSR